MVSKAQLYKGLVNAVDSFARCLQMPDSAELIRDVTKVSDTPTAAPLSHPKAKLPSTPSSCMAAAELCTRQETLRESRNLRRSGCRLGVLGGGFRVVVVALVTVRLTGYLARDSPCRLCRSLLQTGETGVATEAAASELW